MSASGGRGGAEDPGLDDLLEAAETFAREAGALTLRYFGRRMDYEEKADGTPVTRADREAEELLRTRIARRFPGHGVLGEEEGEVAPGASIRWIVDPIDGTKSFLRGVPLYGVLVGVEVQGEPAVGVAHFPALDQTVAAARGGGCRWNGRPCRVSGVSRVDRALVLTTDPARIAAEPVGPGWNRLQRRAAMSRTWGDCWGHALVATGRAEVMVDPVLSSWDAAPLLPILAEAGGRFTDLSGSATIHGGSGVSSNGTLHDEVLEALAPDGRP